MEVNIEKVLNPEYVICLCRNKKTKDVISAVQENDIASLRVLCETAGVGDKCGGCREELEALLDYLTQKNN